MLTQKTLNIPVSRLRATKIELFYLVEEHFQDPRKILTAMGMASAQIYALCSRGGVLTQVYEKHSGKKNYLIDEEKLLEVAAVCEAGHGTFSNAVVWMRDFLKKYWDKAYYCPKVIRNVRHMMADVFKLFTFTPGIKGETVCPPESLEAKLDRLLLFYETLEEKLASLCPPQEEKAIYESADGWVGELSLESGEAAPGMTLKEIVPGEEDLDFLPSHRGALMRLIFNALFGRHYREYRRAEPDTVFVPLECGKEAIEVPHPETLELPPPKQYTPVWKKEFKLSERSWQSMLNKMWNAEVILEWLGLKEEELLYPLF